MLKALLLILLLFFMAVTLLLRYTGGCIIGMFVSESKMWLHVSKSDTAFIGKCATQL